MADDGKPVRWDTVVESDRVLSEKTGKWYEVLEATALTGGRVRVRFVGVPRPFVKPGTETVQVRRGATGKVVDMFVTVLSSGPA